MSVVEVNHRLPPPGLSVRVDAVDSGSRGEVTFTDGQQWTDRNGDPIAAGLRGADEGLISHSTAGSHRGGL